MAFEPFQRAEVPGPIKATVVREAKTLVDIVKKYKKPIIVVGSEVKDFAERGIDLVGYVSKLSKILNARVVVTNSYVREFHSRGIDALFTPLPQLLNNILSTPREESAKPDALIFIGFKYYYLWTMLNNLKHYAYDIDTLSLEPYYHPNAKYSLPTFPLEIWRRFLNDFLSILGV